MITEYIVDVEKDDGHSLVITGSPTFLNAVLQGNRMAKYYVDELGYKVSIEIRETCPTCFDTGRLFKAQKRNKFLGKWHTCPNCEGNPPGEKWKFDYPIPLTAQDKQV